MKDGFGKLDRRTYKSCMFWNCDSGLGVGNQRLQIRRNISSVFLDEKIVQNCFWGPSFGGHEFVDPHSVYK